MSDIGLVYIIDDDASVRDLVEALVRRAGLETAAFASAQEFQQVEIANRPCCILLDLEMPGVTGLDLLESRFRGQVPCPVIVLTAHGSVERAVRSMKLGAVDFVQKPFDHAELIRRIHEAIERDRKDREGRNKSEEARKRLSNLSPRERELLKAVVEGKSTKMIADELGISVRTVDHHRANLMEKMRAVNVADLVRMAVEAGGV